MLIEEDTGQYFPSMELYSDVLWCKNDWWCPLSFLTYVEGSKFCRIQLDCRKVLIKNYAYCCVLTCPYCLFIMCRLNMYPNGMSTSASSLQLLKQSTRRSLWSTPYCDNLYFRHFWEICWKINHNLSYERGKFKICTMYSCATFAAFAVPEQQWHRSVIRPPVTRTTVMWDSSAVHTVNYKQYTVIFKKKMVPVEI